MARVKTKKELVDAYDIIGDILRGQPTGEIEITIEKTKERRLIQIKGDKTYVITSYESRPAKLFADGNIVREDIKPLPKRGLASDIEGFVYGNSNKFEITKQYKDLLTDRIIIVLKKK